MADGVITVERSAVPEISRFFGIVIRMYYDDHPPPHLHAEYQGKRVKLDFQGNVLRGDLESRTALKLAREWIDLHRNELQADWDLARMAQPLRDIPPLD